MWLPGQRQGDKDKATSSLPLWKAGAVIYGPRDHQGGRWNTNAFWLLYVIHKLNFLFGDGSIDLNLHERIVICVAMVIGKFLTDGSPLLSWNRNLNSG